MADALDATTDAVRRALDKGIDYGGKALGVAYGPAAEAAVALFKEFFLADLFADDEVDLADLINKAVEELEEKMKGHDNERLLDAVKGLAYAFGQFRFGPSQHLIDEFLNNSAETLPVLEETLTGKDLILSHVKWAYSNAPAYNLLVSLRAAALLLGNFKDLRGALVFLYRHALKTNYLLVGEPLCRDLRWEGTDSSGFFACPPGTRCFLTGRLWHYAPLVQSFEMEETDKATSVCHPFISATSPGIRLATVGHGDYGLEAPRNGKQRTVVCKQKLENRFHDDEVVKIVLLASEKIVAALGNLNIDVREAVVVGEHFSLRDAVFGEDQPPCRPLRHQLEILMTRRA
jgi:hypothetical protein